MSAPARASIRDLRPPHVTGRLANRQPGPVWKQMPSGRMVDLMAPSPAAIDFAGDIAPALAYLARFDGACTGPLKIAGVRDPVTAPWTVLDHSVVGADLIRSAGGSDRLGLLFLLHDAHEAFTGDITTPAAQAISGWANRAFPDQGGYGAGEAARVGIADFKSAWDAAIFAAAGVPLPDQAEKRALREHDLRMMITERNHMMSRPERSWGDVERLRPLTVTGALRPGNTNRLITIFLERLDAWAPNARPRSTAAALEPLAITPRATGARA
jgi:uncharacterized protein